MNQLINPTEYMICTRICNIDENMTMNMNISILNNIIVI